MRFVLGILLAAVLLAPLPSPAQRGKTNSKTDAERKVEKETAVKTDSTVAQAEDEAARLLREKEKQKGPMSPGKDPAFLLLPKPTERTRIADLMTEEVQAMISRGLAFLVTAQDADGGWSDKDFPSNTGVTALCCLAFMAEGSRPLIGGYGKPLNRGIEYILKNVQSSGVIVGKGAYEYGPMYEHLLSTLTLLLSFGEMPWHPEARSVIERGLEVIHKSQRLDGGWRYQYSSEGQSDVSVTANALWVLRTAKKSGFTVDRKVINRGVQYIEQCAMPDGTFRYRYWGLHANPSMGGTGIIALANHGSVDHPLIPGAQKRILYDYNRYTVADFLEREYFVYGCFYASLAMYTCGDEAFFPWYQKMTRILDAAKRKDGEFADQRDNTVYVTAMALIMLQSPYGYLPIYER
jgi:hypothetical protein